MNTVVMAIVIFLLIMPFAITIWNLYEKIWFLEWKLDAHNREIDRLWKYILSDEDDGK